MEVNLRPETESRLQELAARSGRAPDELVEDAMAGYLQEVAQTREMLDSRFDDLKSGRVKPVDGEKVFSDLRRKSEQRRSGSCVDSYFIRRPRETSPRFGNTLLPITSPPLTA
jgi:predicted transcriptional regulator